MANNPYVNKVQYGNTTLIDLTSDTVTADKLMQGYTAHDRTGALITGTATGGGSGGNVWQDAQGYVHLDDEGTTPITVEPLSVTSNGTYTAQSGHAYSPVTVSVPTPTLTLQTKTASYTPTESAQTESVSADSGYDGLDTVSISVGAISNTYVGSGITRRSSTDLTASGATVTVPSGYYSAQASKAVASGTAGTPTATKVVDTDDASALITPSVTNTTGYITGGTKTGTSFNVTARELVSGTTVTCDDAGNWDVAEAETLVVPSGTAGTPTATKGTVSNHSITVTPSVTNTTGWITGSTINGTAVTVTASELASGNKSISDNGSNIDVVGYATVSVSVPTVTITQRGSNLSIV